MRAVVLLPLALLVPCAVDAGTAAGEEVDLVAVEVPGVAIADRPFAVAVTLESRIDERRDVYLYSVLYAPSEGGPCGPQTSGRWRGVVSFSPGVAVVAVGPGETRAYPDGSDREGAPPRGEWLHRVNRSAAPSEGEYELCVFAMKESGAALRDVAEHYDFHSTRLRIRPGNAPPTADFAWTPVTPNATTPVAFVARGSDPDGDSVSFGWDFGRYTPKGRAVASGADATHRFYPEGQYVVTLVATDGWDRAEVRKTVVVLPEEVPTPPDPAPPEADVPAAGVVAVVVLAAVTARTRRSP